MLMLDSTIINTISSRASNLCLCYEKFIISRCYLSITYKGHFCQCQRFVIDVNILGCHPRITTIYLRLHDLFYLHGTKVHL